MQFELPELADACWVFIENCLTTGRGESLLVPTRAYSQHEISKQIFDKVHVTYDIVSQSYWDTEVGICHPLYTVITSLVSAAFVFTNFR